MIPKLTEDEEEAIFDLAQNLVGSYRGSRRRNIIVANVRHRMQRHRIQYLADYLALVERDQSEFERFISAITIHFTGWFRESIHFSILAEQFSVGVWKDFDGSCFETVSVGCSSGEEVYSLGLVLEHHRRKHPDFNYNIIGLDIDPISLRKAREAMYPMSEYYRVPEFLRIYLRPHCGKGGRFFKPVQEILSRTQLGTVNIAAERWHLAHTADLIVCRNVLIYFSADLVETVLSKLRAAMRPKGALILGHSEAKDLRALGLSTRGHSMFFSADATMPLGLRPTARAVSD